MKKKTRIVDGQTLEGLEDASFDVVSSLFGVFMFPDRAAAWRSAWRVLKPGGRLIATSWDIGSVNLRMARYVAEAGLSPSDAAAASGLMEQMLETNRMFRAEPFREELEEFGFQDVTIHSTSHPMCFRSGQEFVASRMMDSGATQALAMLDFAQATLEGVDPFSVETKANEREVGRHALWDKPIALQALGHIAVATKPL